MNPNIGNLVDEFFLAPRMPVSTHEEWLLRLCSSLMEREAQMASHMESRQNQSERTASTTASCETRKNSTQKASCSDLDASTERCTETETTSLEEL